MPNTTHNNSTGALGEKYVAEWLSTEGFTIVDCNVYTRAGEIDIVATKGQVLHIIEVKTRRSRQFGYVETAMTRKKLSDLRRAIYQLFEEGVLPNKRFQIDFAAVELDSGGKCTHTMYWNIGPDDVA